MTFENQVKKAALELEIAKIRLKLYNFAEPILYEKQRRELAEGWLFGCNTNYRATEKSYEMTPKEVSHINKLLDKIDLLEEQIYNLSNPSPSV